MARLHKVPVGGNADDRKVILPDTVQVSLSEIAASAQNGLLAFSVALGLQVLDVLIDEDVHRAVGDKGKWNPSRKAAVRHGKESSSIAVGDRKVAMRKPRVRSVDGGEVGLPTFEFFRSNDLLKQMAFDRITSGVSTRDYRATLEPIGDVDPKSTGRSTISRRFAARAQVALDELNSKDLSELDIRAMLVDGKHVAGETVVVALGVDIKGEKHPLGLRHGTTENAGVCKQLMRSLVARGLDFSSGILFVIDGGKGLRSAIKQVFGQLGLIQRCRLHKQRNVRDHLPQHLHRETKAKMNKAWAEKDADRALRALNHIADSFNESYPDAAGSMREGLDETLTITRLGIPPALTKTLFSTNPVESMISISRDVARNVKRWCSGKMVLQWTAVGMEVAQKQFRRVKGCKEMPLLVEGLAAHTKEASHQETMIAYRTVGLTQKFYDEWDILGFRMKRHQLSATTLVFDPDSYQYSLWPSNRSFFVFTVDGRLNLCLLSSCLSNSDDNSNSEK